MFVLVSYDIVDDGKRTKAAKMLLAYGKRVQKSVFECHVDDKRYIELKGKLESLVDLSIDSVRFYSVCKRCLGAIEVVGWGTVTEDLSDGPIIV
ncbi:MAG: CRISPR-associated endonuclease Cas2 [Proteobacteria bacterium]|nr:CRISPR-associated endonuclease Cas2 [Pseudomonadota bacterium]